MTKSDLRIDILGTNFTISADEDPDYLETLLEKYRKTVDNVQQVSGLKDPLKIAVLTGFLLCDDLEKAGIETAPGKKDDSGEAEQLTLGMISRLDEVIFHSSETPDTVIKDTVSEPDSAFPEIYKLQNSVKNYDWGSPVWIPALLGQKNVSRIPWAELWMGVHPSAPSRVITGETGNTEKGPATSGAYPLLSDLIGENKESFLGTETARLYGKLPYLFKVLAAAKPLSIQAHPSKEQAVEGFERENREGIPLGAETRNYKDDGDKPEIICAIGPYVALCGFRKPEEIDTLLRIISRDSEGELKAGFESLISALEQKNENPYTAFLKALFGLDRGTLASLGPFLKNRQVQLERDFPEYLDEWDLCSYLARLYPGDTGIISPLYLNILELSIGEAMFIPSGVLHAYIHGMGIELMADSDNVLRGGLTSKHVDPDELYRILNFSEYKPEIKKLPDPAPSWFTYPSGSKNFALSVMRSTGDPVLFPETGPSIVIVTQGDATIAVPGRQNKELKTGESVFIPARPSIPGQAEKRGIVFSGTFTAYVAAPGKPTDKTETENYSGSTATDTPEDLIPQ